MVLFLELLVIGPVAQDFYAAFGVGHGERHIATVDADGVALAAIQALKKENDTLKKQNQEIQEQTRAILKRLEALEASSSMAKKEEPAVPGEDPPTT